MAAADLFWFLAVSLLSPLSFTILSNFIFIIYSSWYIVKYIFTILSNFILFIFTLYSIFLLDNVIYLLYYVFVIIKERGLIIIDFLEKLDFLMSERGIKNKHSLSEQSGIAYTTINNWYKRKYDNMSLSIFKQLCDFFGVTMDSMARDDIAKPQKRTSENSSIHITEEEKYFITCFRQSDSLDKELALRAIHAREKGAAEKMA